MSGYKTFALAGAGNLGMFVAKELLRLKDEGSISKVSILTRSNESSTELAKLGANIIELDYDSAASITKALTGIDVFISTWGAPTITKQIELAEPAKQAGVKLFVPSEFGADTEEINRIPFQGAKLDVQKKLRDIGLPYTLFQTGTWSDTCFVPFFGFDLKNGKINFGGGGDAPITFTTRQDVARFTVHALLSFPRKKLEWESVRMEGDRQSFNAILSAYEKRKGVKLDITRRSREELEEAIKKNPNDIFSMFFLAWDLGGGALEDLANSEWPEWNPQSVIDVIA
ncbi:NAD-P-binding protein [Schizopora paradoxa]|uniref:NAD-P-binding protein n=1 Tax=Schizopora paradoxa TaxID=27342 RepID=A0A0H2RS48_9AGAM|nr:NAD-P-binding protein [Schizopora paradoxa]